ncbi:hypothetical protein LTR85_008780 [Meristemomyces frigidus]|nr:hypothetical protein LTR85_008780 [Meristemomyces frigidus]
MEVSPFRRLPAELREQTYKLVLHEPEGVHFSIEEAPRVTTGRSHRLAITKVCKPIRHESLPLWYSADTFMICTMSPDECS